MHAPVLLSVHVFMLPANVPAPAGALNVIVPVGLNPVTCTFTIVVEPTGIDDGLSETVMTEVICPTASVAELGGLAWLFASPL